MRCVCYLCHEILELRQCTKLSYDEEQNKRKQLFANLKPNHFKHEIAVEQ